MTDANGTRYHLLLGRDDWTACRCAQDVGEPEANWRLRVGHEAAPLAWDDQASEVTLRRRGFRFAAAKRDTVPGLAARRGAAADLYGNWYWIDPAGDRIRVRSSGDGAVSNFWPPAQPVREAVGAFEPATPRGVPARGELRGIAVTPDHYLVAGTLQPKGLLLFDLFAGGEPVQLLWPGAVAFEPFDIAAGPDCGVWILDRAHKRYWMLDRHFDVAADGQASRVVQAAADPVFQPAGATTPRRIPERAFPAGVDLGAAHPLPSNDPIAIDVAADGTLLVLDLPASGGPAFSSLLALHQGGWKRLALDGMQRHVALEPGEVFSLVGHDFVLVPAGEDATQALGDAYIADAAGNQAYAFRLSTGATGLHIDPLPEYLPMRRFGGKGLVLHRELAHYDFGEGWVPLVRQPRPRYREEGSLRTPVLDGKTPDCVWHRILLDACIPADASVELWTRAADEPALLEGAAWMREPRPYLRRDGTELPFVSAPWAAGGARTAGAIEGTWELLLQQACGRYLEVRMRIAGNERSSPRVRAMRVYYPRFSYLDEYLPAIYREEPASARFLDGFLANIEGFYTAIEDRVANVHVLFDWRSAPREALEWLAGWLGAALDPSWDEARRRLFIRHAMLYYRYRGTAHGLRLALSLALDERVDESRFAPPEAVPEERFGVRIVERYLTRKLPDVLFGDPSQLEAPKLEDAAPWKPQDGGAALRERYARFLGSAPGATLPPFPMVPPQDAAAWAQFCEGVLGFTPWAAALEREAWQLYLAATYRDLDALNEAWGSAYGDFAKVEMPADQPLEGAPRADWSGFMRHAQPPRTPLERRRWHAFLHARHGPISAINARYGKAWDALDLVPLPDQLPADGAALDDWFQFEAMVLAMAGAAHRFRVLLPMPTGPRVTPGEPRRRLELATRIVEMEKPAHAVFDVRFYWAMFLVGEARLGRDTQIESGIRERLIPALVLGQGYVGEGFVAPTAAEGRTDRHIAGRQRLH